MGSVALLEERMPQDHDLPQNATSTSIEQSQSTSVSLVQATTTSATVMPVPTASVSLPSSPTSNQLGVAIGASVGVPIGVIILLGILLTCLWRWKKRQGSLGLFASRRSQRNAMEKDNHSGSRFASAMDADDDLDGLKRLEAGLTEPKQVLQSPTNPLSKKGVDLVAASLAAKEALLEAEKLGKSNPVIHSATTISPMINQKQQLQNEAEQPRRHYEIVFSKGGEPKTEDFNTPDPPIAPPINWPLHLDVPDPPIAPPEVLREIYSTPPLNPLRSHPPQTAPMSNTRLPQTTSMQAQSYPSTQAKQYDSERQLHPQPTVPKYKLSQTDQYSMQKPQTQAHKQTPVQPSIEPSTLAHTLSSRSRDQSATKTKAQPEVVTSMSSDEEDVSALPPMPHKESYNSKPHKSRSNPLLSGASFRATRNSSKRNPPVKGPHHRPTRSASSYGRNSSSSYSQSPSQSPRPTSPKSMNDSSAPHRVRHAPSFPVHAELQRRAQERALLQQRRAIGENYGRMMRDWEAGPLRRMGDGRDFVDPHQPSDSRDMEASGSKNPADNTRVSTDNTRVSTDNTRVSTENIRIPTLRGPGSRGQTREPEPRRPTQGP